MTAEPLTTGRQYGAVAAHAARMLRSRERVVVMVPPLGLLPRATASAEPAAPCHDSGPSRRRTQ